MPVITVCLLQTKTIIIIIKAKLETTWKTHVKQIFCSQNYSNIVLENNFSQYLNTSLKNTKQKTVTKHTLCFQCLSFLAESGLGYLFLEGKVLLKHMAVLGGKGARIQKSKPTQHFSFKT